MDGFRPYESEAPCTKSVFTSEQKLHHSPSQTQGPCLGNEHLQRMASIWYADVATPNTNESGKARKPLLMAGLRNSCFFRPLPPIQSEKESTLWHIPQTSMHLSRSAGSAAQGNRDHRLRQAAALQDTQTLASAACTDSGQLWLSWNDSKPPSQPPQPLPPRQDLAAQAPYSPQRTQEATCGVGEESIEEPMEPPCRHVKIRRDNRQAKHGEGNESAVTSTG